ncbi:MAG: transporter substrate-binding domain-containing protein [Deltaproteobacteria bacterium]|nr:transporter substrate-binding domain-containing protein [Deltaproteobacteria bacterium]
MTGAVKIFFRVWVLATLPVFVFSTPLSALETVEGVEGLPSAISRIKETKDLPEMKKRGFIRALVTFSKTDFFLTDGRPRGLQTEYLQQYEKILNKGLGKRERRTGIVYIPVPFNRLIPALTAGEGDIAAAYLTITPEREKQVAFVSGRRRKIDELVVTAKGVKDLNTVEDLSGRMVYVLRGSSYAAHLRALNTRLRAKGRKPVNIREADVRLLTEDILEMVNAGVVEITVSDDYKARLWAEVLPGLVVRDDLKVNSGGNIGWAVRKNNPKLIESLNRLVPKIRKGSSLGNILYKRYYENTRWIKNPLVRGERIKFGNFVALFRKYGDQYGFDYLAVAAQAYQESGFDQSKKSHAGAVGVMQLLPSTAADPNVGIPDIKDPDNNIHAGVKYMAFLRDRYFSDPAIRKIDRFAFSWAAYNAGPARVRKMRARAEKMGLDRNKWFRNVEHAALKIVGQETVRYVANIYKYYIVYSLAKDLVAEKKNIMQGKGS